MAYKLTSGSPLLHYGLITDPFPLQASPEEGNLIQATLTVIASNPTDSAVALQGIIVQLPVGGDATDLTPSPSEIGPVPPLNWRLQDTQTGGGVVKFIFQPQSGSSSLPKGDSLTFVFNNIQVNRAAGTFEAAITEGTNNCVPPDCPVATFYVTKFPSGWGQVSFWVDPPVIPRGSATTLHWSGPAGATYTIEYYTPQTGIVRVPRTGEPPLASRGQYPAVGAPPLDLDQSTSFTLSVEQRIANQPYYAQDQKTVVVATPKPNIVLFEGEMQRVGSQFELVLNWDALYAKFCTISGDPNQLKPSSTDGSYKILPSRQKPLRSTYTLTATNEAGESTSTLTLEWGEKQKVPVGRSPSDVAILPDGSRAYTSNGYGLSVSVLDVAATPVSAIGTTVTKPYWPVGVTTTSDGRYVLVSSTNGVSNPGAVYVFAPTSDPNAPVRAVGQPVKVGVQPWGLAVSPDDKYVLVACWGPLVAVLERTSDPNSPYKSIPSSLKFGKLPAQIAVSPDSRRAYVIDRTAYIMTTLDLTSSPIATIGNPAPLGRNPVGITISPDGSRIYVACALDGLYVFTPTTDAENPVRQLAGPIPAGTPIRVVVSPDGARVFSTDWGSRGRPGFVRVYDVTTNSLEPAGAPIEVGQLPNGIAISPNGDRVLATNYEGTDSTVSVLQPVSASGGVKRVRAAWV